MQRQFHGQRINLFSEWHWTDWTFIDKIWTLTKKINSNWIVGLNVRVKTIILLEENTRENHWSLRLGKNLNMTCKNDKLEIIKMWSFWHVKDTARKDKHSLEELLAEYHFLKNVYRENTKNSQNSLIRKQPSKKKNGKRSEQTLYTRKFTIVI